MFRIIESFLHDHKVKVILDGQNSSTYCITSGVPQGSILGPILFLIFINDLPDNIISELAIFADDTSLYSCLNQKSGLFECFELAGSLELDLSLVFEWALNGW